MYKNIFLLLTLLLFTGCAERGYKLTSNIHTRTATAETTINIGTQTKDVPQKLEKMKDAVKKELNNQKLTVSKVNIFQPVFTEDQLLSSSTEDLIFKRINQTYQKFGDSEIHGHVIYLNASGKETKLDNSKIYLLAVSKKLNNWYTNSYLKNNRHSNHGTTTNYLNQTYLNLSKNFAFHGIAPGEYFVIIVSDNPTEDKTNQKVYIAKKLKVEKRKKIMAVFSKKI